MSRFNSIDTVLGTASLFVTITMTIVLILAGTIDFWIPPLGPIPIISFLLISCKIANDLGINTERERWEGHRPSDDIEANPSKTNYAFTAKHQEVKPTAFEQDEPQLDSRLANPWKDYSTLTASQRKEELSALNIEKEQLESE
jgi:hypothetical protein